MSLSLPLSPGVRWFLPEFLRLRHRRVLHGETEFAVFDGNDFYFDFIADCQDCGWMFDSFGADLGDVDEAGEAVSEADEGAVWLQALNGSFGDEADFYVGDFLFALFVCFLAENFAGGEDQAVFFFVEVKNLY